MTVPLSTKRNKAPAPAQQGEGSFPYRAERAADGSYTIFDVEVFSEHERHGVDFNAAWMKAAIQRHRARQKEGYSPPLHVHHHGTEDRVEFAGHFNLKGVYNIKYEGEPKATLVADFTNVPAEVYEKLAQGVLPYRSVEILDIARAEIDSIALLDHEVPYFRFRNLKPERVEDRSVAFAQLDPRYSPALCYSASPPATVFEFTGGQTMKKVWNEKKGQWVWALDKDDKDKKKKDEDEPDMAAGAHEDEDDKKKDKKPDFIAADDDEEDEDEEVEVEVEEIEEEVEVEVEPEVVEPEPEAEMPPVAEARRSAAAAFVKAKEMIEGFVMVFAQLGEELGLGEEESEPEVEPELELEPEEEEIVVGGPVEMMSADKKKKMSAKAGKKAKAGTGVKYAALQGRVRALESKLEKKERTAKIEVAISKALKRLVKYGLNDETEAELRKVAAKHGTKGVKAYVQGVERHGTPDPDEGFEDEDVLAEFERAVKDVPALQVYSAQGPEVMQEMQHLTAQYNASPPRLRGQFTLEQYIGARLNGPIKAFGGGS